MDLSEVTTALTGGAVAYAVYFVAKGALVPRRVIEEALRDRDEWRTRVRIEEQRFEETERVLSNLSVAVSGKPRSREIDKTVSSLQQQRAANHYVRSLVRPTGITVASDHQHQWEDVVLSDDTLVNRICTTPGCWAENADIKESYARSGGDRTN